MSNLLEKIGFVFEDPYKRAKEEKLKGSKVIGITPMFFPQEIVHAANCLPVILQASKEPITLGFSHYHHFFCGLTRGIVDLAAKGKLDFLDGLILSDMCFEMRHIADPLRRFRRFPLIYIQWPLEANEERWLNFITKRLGKCVSKLEELFGNRISDQKIEESIQIYNKNRALLRQIYELRKAKPGILSAKEMSALVIFSMVTPVEENNKFLSELISELERVQRTVESDTRLILSGHLCHEVKDGILDLIETMGGVVVGDDLYTGLRYYASDVDPNTRHMEAFARRYLNLTVPCPTRVDIKRDWAEFLIQSFKEQKAKGIIMILAKNCEPHMIYYPYIKARLESAGIPHILIQVEYEMVSLEGIRTRIQAFIEMLRD